MDVFTLSSAPPRFSGRFLGVVLGVAMLAGSAYIAAAMAASGIASTLSARETLRHAQSVEHEAAVTRAFARYRAERAQCSLLESHERDDCVAAANRLQRIAIRGAAA